jgi:hypothetical protein
MRSRFARRATSFDDGTEAVPARTLAKSIRELNALIQQANWGADLAG